MKSINPFERSEFIPEFTDYAALQGSAVGMTGARGMLGRLLRARLEHHGIETAAYPGNVNNLDELASWFASLRLRHFFHFAALVPVVAVEADPLLAFQTNVIGTFNVCQQLLKTQPGCWLFHCSSSHVYQPTPTSLPIQEDAPKNPPTFYGTTKLLAERVVDTLMSKLRAPYCVGRVFSYTHVDQAPPYLVPNLRQKISALRDGAALDITNAASVRDIQDAEQVIDTILHLAQRTATGTVNIGTGVGQSVGEIALLVARSLGKQIQVTGRQSGPPESLIADTKRLRLLLAPPGLHSV